MNRVLTPRQQELIAEHRRNGCVEVRWMAAGTRISLATTDEHFELEVGTPERGVVLLATDRRFPQREKAVVAGSFDPSSREFLPEIIGQNLNVVFRVQGIGVVRTRPVLSAIVRDNGDTYEYDLWGE